MDKLPPELLAKVIGENHADRKALVACSVVSRSWRTSSLRWLFDEVKLKCSSQQVNIEPFVDFLSESPHIAQSITVLQLNGLGRDLEFQSLSSIVSILTRLRDLFLQRFTIVGKTSADASWPQLECLGLNGVLIELSDGHNLPSVIGLFPRLRNLIMSNVLDPTLSSAQTVSAGGTGLGLRLNRLFLMDPSDDVVAFAVQHVVSCATLRLSFDSMRPLSGLGQLVRNVSSSVINFEFRRAFGRYSAVGEQQTFPLTVQTHFLS